MRFDMLGTNCPTRCAFCCATGKTQRFRVCRFCNEYRSAVPCFKRQRFPRRLSLFVLHRPRHPTHPCTKRFSPCGIFVCFGVGGRRLEPRLARIGFVVGGSPLGVESALGVLAFLALPCCGLSHRTKWLLRLQPSQQKYRLWPKSLRPESPQETRSRCTNLLPSKCQRTSTPQGTR
jgi:hypothetical protein